MAKLRYIDALALALREEMRRDPDVFLVGEEVAQYQGTLELSKGFLEEFGPRRVIDTPISEVGIIGLGIGAAMAGLRPVCEMMRMDFATPAYDQIVQHAAKIRYMFGGQFQVPMVIRGPSGVGLQLSAQHSQAIEVLFAHVPGLKVAVPATPADAKGMLLTAIRDNNPVMFLESLRMYFTKPDELEAIQPGLSEVPDGPDFSVPLGQANVLREGKDVTIVAYSWMTIQALKAANILAKDGIFAEVIDLRSLLPLDMNTVLASIKKTHRAVVVQEQWPLYGCAAEISAQIGERAFYDLDSPVLRVTGAFVPMPYAKNLENLAFPTEVDIVAAAKRALGGK
ncbi:alpha-ketoacid dehydrogenase subunit beta [Armatimonas sp.]|uniref:alpha-ketoacid dehydrogenase subunit beta n=1 Tax=Armatimonas sp. TaxID=1872638 RepID=UPI003753107C